MSQKVSLPTLPVEILHRIFDQLDPTRIFFSVHDVCQPLRVITAAKYLRHRLDFISTSNSDSSGMCHRSASLTRRHSSLHLTPFIDAAEYREKSSSSICERCKGMFRHFSDSSLDILQLSESERKRDCAQSLVDHCSTHSTSPRHGQ